MLKRLIFGLCFTLMILHCGRLLASFGHVQGAMADSGTSTSTFNIVLASNPTSKNLVCVGVILGVNGSALTVKDGNGNSYNVTSDSPATFAPALTKYGLPIS